jgi:hypothetical protein
MHVVYEKRENENEKIEKTRENEEYFTSENSKKCQKPRHHGFWIVGFLDCRIFGLLDNWPEKLVLLNLRDFYPAPWHFQITKILCNSNPSLFLFREVGISIGG